VSFESDVQPVKYLIGTGVLLEWAMASWREVEPDTVLHPIDIGQDRDYRFDLSTLLDVRADAATAFVAWGPQFLNFRRLELMSELKSRGFKMPSLICKGALLASGVSVGENCVIGAGSIIGSGCKIGFNSVIGAGCILGPATQVASSAWISDGVQIGMQARIGANATIGSGVTLANEIGIGKQSVVDRPGRYSSSFLDKSFLIPAFPKTVNVIDYGATSS
jgi:hypothetical protein